MPTRVWLVRHAETARPEVFHGAESDIELGERGRRQVTAAAPVFAAYRPDIVVSSAMRRAVATAGPVAELCGLPLRVEPDLHERRVGELGGRPAGGHPLWLDTVRRWTAGETGYAPPGSESFDDVRNRVLPVWERLTTEYAGRSVLVVAHGHVCRVLLLTLLPGRSVADWRTIGPIANVGVSELLRDDDPAGPWRAVRVNDVPPEVRAVGEVDPPAG
jgi:probable phosphoglycerate mutase